MSIQTSAPAPFRDVIETAEDLAALYGPPEDVVVSKIIDRLDRHCRDFIARAPFVLVGSVSTSGRCDVSPKGGAPGFVHVLDEHRLAIPDAPGNRLIDSLRNVRETGRVGLLFLIPGLEETLRVNGRAWLTRDPEIIERFGGEKKPPRVATGVEVEEAFLHCAKAFKRSGLWRPDDWPALDGLARPAVIWKDHMKLTEMTLEELEKFVAKDYVDNLEWK
jgi:PPOX class probable FMN-dependent enzyme